MKVGLHLRSVLIRLLFAAVMDVISSEARSELPSELLYADDLCHQQWSILADVWLNLDLLDKGLKVNAGK